MRYTFLKGNIVKELKEVIEPVDAESDMEAALCLLTLLIERDCGFWAVKAIDMTLAELMSYVVSYEAKPVAEGQGAMAGAGAKIIQPVGGGRELEK